MDETTIKKCNACASEGLTYRLSNGRPQVMIGENYMREARDGMSYMQQASILADMIASGKIEEDQETSENPVFRTRDHIVHAPADHDGGTGINSPLFDTQYAHPTSSFFRTDDPDEISLVSPFSAVPFGFREVYSDGAPPPWFDVGRPFFLNEPLDDSVEVDWEKALGAGKARVESKTDLDKYGADRPIGGIRIRLVRDCDCDVNIDLMANGSFCNNHDRNDLSETIAKAIENREDWLQRKNFGYPVSTDPDCPRPALGVWQLKGRHGDREVTKGYAVAIALIVSFDCACEIVGNWWHQEELRDGGWEPDNYGANRVPPINENRNLMAGPTSYRVNVSGTPSERCAVVFVDSIGFSRPAWPDNPDMVKFMRKRFRAWSIVRHKEKSDCWGRAWLTWEVALWVKGHKAAGAAAITGWGKSSIVSPEGFTTKEGTPF